MYISAYLLHPMALMFPCTRSGLVWDTDENIQLRSEISEGLNITEIAKKHQRTEWAIQCRIKHLNNQQTPQTPQPPQTSQPPQTTTYQSSSQTRASIEDKMISILVQTDMSAQNIDLIFSYMFGKSLNDVHYMRKQIAHKLMKNGRNIEWVFQLTKIPKEELST
jgi:hypothetical protein